MSALQPEIPGATVLDLFAGSGALGLEALSRGAERVTFVERARGALGALQRNVEALEAGEACRVVRADAVAWIRQLQPGAFDLALADPPYGQGLASLLVEHFAAVPFARWLWVEHGADETLPPLPGSRTRRYGDTGVTSIPAAQGSEP